MLAPRAQLWDTSLQVTRELYLKSLSHDPSGAGKQGCQHNDDFILPAELLHRDYPPSFLGPSARSWVLDPAKQQTLSAAEVWEKELCLPQHP